MEYKKSEFEWRKGVVGFLFSGNKVRMGVYGKGNKVEESFDFTKDLLPEYPTTVNPRVEYFVTYTLKDGQVHEVTTILPVTWREMNVKLVNMTRPNNDQSQPPAPYTVTKSWGDEQHFYMFYQVVDKDSEYFGCVFPIRYKYMLCGNPEGKTVLSSDPNRSYWARMLNEHLDQLMDTETPISFPDDGNVLPELLMRAKNEGKVITMSGKVGQHENGDWGFWLEVKNFIALSVFNKPKATEPVDFSNDGFDDDVTPVDEAFPSDDMLSEDEDEWTAPTDFVW